MKKIDLEIALKEGVSLPDFKFTKIRDSLGFKSKKYFGSVYLTINASYFPTVSIKLKSSVTALFTVDKIESMMDYYFRPHGYESNRLTFLVSVGGMFDKNSNSVRNENELQYAIDTLNSFLVNTVLPKVGKLDSIANIYSYSEKLSLGDLNQFYGSIIIKRLIIRAMVKDPFIDECIIKTKNILKRWVNEGNDPISSVFLANYNAFVIGLKELWETTSEDISGIEYKRGDYGHAV